MATEGKTVRGQTWRILAAFGLAFLTLFSLNNTPAAEPTTASLSAEELRAQAGTGNLGAQTDLALQLLSSQATPEAVAEGLSLLQKAAQADYPRAQYQLGLLSAEGHQIPQDWDAAIRWYKKAADIGYAPAEYQLGLLFEKGNGVTLNRPEAQRWYQRAAERHNPQAEAALARLHYNGFFGYKDLVAAKYYSQCGAARGDAECAERLAAITLSGTRREEPELIEAAKWALLAAWFQPPRTAAFLELKPQLSESMLTQAREKATLYELTRREGGPLSDKITPPAQPQFEGRPFVELPAYFTSSGIAVPLEIVPGKPVYVILDTGANSSLLDARTAKALDLTSSDQGAVSGVGSRAMLVDIVNDLDCKVGPLPFKGGSLTSCPLDYLRPYGEKIRGLLGYNFLCRSVVEIDYYRKIVRFHDPRQFRYTGTGQRLPLRIEDGALYVRTGIVTGDGYTIHDEFLVDTGYGGAISFTRYFLRDNQVFRNVLKVEGAASLGIGGTLRTIYGRIPALTLGTSRIDNPVALFAPVSKGGLAQMPTGLLGARILSRFHVYFDYPRKEMIIEPNEHLNDPFEFQTHGLRFITTDDSPPRLKVNNVLAASPAEEAGFRFGDLLIALDNTPASDLTLEKIYRILGDGQEHTLQIKRGADTLTLRVKERTFI